MAAGIGDKVQIATKPELARTMLGWQRPGSRSPGSPLIRPTAGKPRLRAWLEEHGIPYVMAVSCSEMIPTVAGKTRADELAALVPAGGWQRLSCADGSKGPRFYDWALIGARSPQHHLLVRRSLQPNEKGVLECPSAAAAHPVP
jgi:hypothetical protein